MISDEESSVKAERPGEARLRDAVRRARQRLRAREPASRGIGTPCESANSYEFGDPDDNAPPRRVKLLHILTTRCSAEDLRTLCFVLGVNHEVLPGTGKAGTVTVKIPQIELRNVSSDRAGSVTGQLVSQLFPALLSSILSEAQGLVPTDFLKDLDSQVFDLAQSLGDEASKLVKPLGEGLQRTIEDTGLDKTAEDAGKTLEKGAEGAKDALEGFFGPKKEE